MFKTITVIAIIAQFILITGLFDELQKHRKLIELEEEQIVVLSQAAGLLKINPAEEE